MLLSCRTKLQLGLTVARQENNSDSDGMLLKLVTGNGQRRTGNGQRESWNECTARTHLRIQHGGQRKGKGNNLGEM